MTFQPVKVPTIPIPFHKLMKIVAIVDPNDMQTKELLEQLTAERYVVEVTDSFDRDVSVEASVGAYIALVDGERLESAQRLAEAVRVAGFETPLLSPMIDGRIANESEEPGFEAGLAPKTRRDIQNLEINPLQHIVGDNGVLGPTHQ